MLTVICACSKCSNCKTYQTSWSTPPCPGKPHQPSPIQRYLYSMLMFLSHRTSGSRRGKILYDRLITRLPIPCHLTVSIFLALFEWWLTGCLISSASPFFFVLQECSIENVFWFVGFTLSDSPLPRPHFMALGWSETNACGASSSPIVWCAMGWASLSGHIYIWVDGSCLTYFINPQRNLPTTQKKRIKESIAVMPGLVRISNRVFGWAGSVDDMPRVPDGRAGVYNRVGLLSRGWGHQ